MVAYNDRINRCWNELCVRETSDIEGGWNPFRDECVKSDKESVWSKKVG